MDVDFNDAADAVPAYLCMIAMPMVYSISEGIAIGVISYVVIQVVCGKAKKITPLMYVLAVLFICKYLRGAAWNCCPPLHPIYFFLNRIFR